MSLSRLLDRKEWEHKRVPRNINQAIQFDKISYVKSFLKFSGNLNFQDSEGLSPIHIAAKYGRLKLFKLLMKQGCDVNHVSPSGDFPLLIAVKHSQCEIVEILLKKKVNPNWKESPASESVLYQCKDLKVLHLLLSSDAVCSPDEILRLISNEHYIMVYHILNKFPTLLTFKDDNSRKAFFQFVDFMSYRDPIIFIQKHFHKYALK